MGKLRNMDENRRRTTDQMRGELQELTGRGRGLPIACKFSFRLFYLHKHCFSPDTDFLYKTEILSYNSAT